MRRGLREAQWIADMAGLAAPWRGRPLLAGGLAASVLAHAALFAAMSWHAAAPRPAARPAAPGRVAVVWLSAPAAPAAVAKPMPQAEARSTKPARRAAPTATPSPAVSIAAQAPAPSASEPISAAVFALPTIGFGGGGGARWMRHRDEPAAPRPAMPPPQALSQAMHDAGRTQMALALQQRLAVLPAPAEGSDGRCALRDDNEAPLACDSDALHTLELR